MSVLFFGFSFSPHISTILPNISATMVVARALRFLFRILARFGGNCLLEIIK
jgi:hypothetical protein